MVLSWIFFFPVNIKDYHSEASIFGYEYKHQVINKENNNESNFISNAKSIMKVKRD